MRHWPQSRVSIQFTRSYKVTVRRGEPGCCNMHPALTHLLEALIMQADLLEYPLVIFWAPQHITFMEISLSTPS
jgi:hypothetical protein